MSETDVGDQLVDKLHTSLRAESISDLSTNALVMGILGLVCCAPLGILAIIAGNKAEKMIAQEGIGQEQKGKATIGKILGIEAVVLWGVFAIVWWWGFLPSW